MIQKPKLPLDYSNSNDQAIWQWNSEVMNVANEENLIIDVDYTYDTNNFFDTQEKKDVFEETINEIAARLGDDLASIDPSNLSVNTWDMVFTHPGTGNRATLTDQIIEANTLRIFVGGAPLGGTTLGRGGSGSYSVSGFSDFLDSVTTDINLSSTSIDENVPTNSTVGTFSTTDSTGETFTYTLSKYLCT
ncbi:hypothetical protein Dacsa_2595 [Dactylococcopsis salina PCC 8305]|uniref:Uncharacterized protein n=2 Tax=Dactylococcopsis salina TaxID=292566 RepID=K9YXH3_DACS8|nr:hypothetical protein Dacsa_2595 [Dactylococcopsis salina PCC 8305]